jgi:hypothetical protein
VQVWQPDAGRVVRPVAKEHGGEAAVTASAMIHKFDRYIRYIQLD